MTDYMDICLRHGFDELDLCDPSNEEIPETVKYSLENEPEEDARLISIESDGTLETISIEGGYLVTGGCSDIFEDYDILPTILGTGHYGCVREYLHRATGEKYAVKTIDKSKAERLDHIKREIELLCSVNHPGIMKVADCYEDDNFVHIVTERYTGGELFDRIVDNASDYGCLPEEQAASIVRSLLEAVEYLHSKDIVHRDIKPENILFESDEEGSSVKLVDFGLSRRHGLNDVPMSNRVGTSYYMSPSILKENYDRACDLWAVGIVAYILLCGYPPFNGCDDYQIEMSVLRGDLVFDQGVWGNLSRASRDLVRKLLCRDSSRTGTASEALRHPWIAQG